MSTRRFYMDDCTIPLPAGFRDRTVHVLEWQMEDGESIALVVQREALPASSDGEEAPEAAFARFVEGEVRDYPSQFDGFHRERDETAVGSGFEMRRIAFRWRKEREVLYHHQAFVLVGEGAVLFTGSSKALHRDAVDRLLEEALAGLRVRGD